MVEGELDLSDEDGLVDDVEAMLDDDAGSVHLDLTGVEFIDSSGVRAILRLHLDHSDRVRLVALSDAVNRVLRIAGLIDVLGVTEPADP